IKFCRAATHFYLIINKYLKLFFNVGRVISSNFGRILKKFSNKYFYWQCSDNNSSQLIQCLAPNRRVNISW
ncbi:hypothetical protein V6377_07420, partial [Acinetobacter baumannii]